VKPEGYQLDTAKILYSLPIALMVAEFVTLMPEEGGYYIWVREALGPFWAVQEAWWAMVRDFSD
jgi:amino acid transporter